MKLIFILFCLLFSLQSFTQQLTTNEVVEIFKTNHSKVEPLMIDKGFDFNKEDNSKYPVHTITFRTNSKNITDLESIEFFYSENDLNLIKNKVLYSFIGKQKHNNLIKSLITNGFRYLHSIDTEGLLVKYYIKETDNPNRYISASMFILQDYFYSLIIEFNIIP